MKPRSSQHIVITALIVATLLLFWILSTQSRGLAGVYDSPLSTPSPMNLAFTSPLPEPAYAPEFAPSGPRFPREMSILRTPEPQALGSDTFRSPLADPTPTLVPWAYLPEVYHNYPLPLHYGPKGLAGVDSFSLFGEDYDAYYAWGVYPNWNDELQVRMIWCVTDYHLYGDYGGPDFQSQIIQAAQADRGVVAGRVWLVFNEPETISGNPQDPNTWQCGHFPFSGDPDNAQNNHPWVAEDAAEAAVRYSLVYDWIKDNDPNAKVYAGGLLQIHTAIARNWWTLFVNTLAARGELYKIEGVHVHSYPEWSTSGNCTAHYCIPEVVESLNEWYNSYHVGRGLGDRPIWVTETGAGPYCNKWEHWDPQGWVTVRDEIMKPLSWWFTGDTQWPHSNVPTNPGYDAIHWFVTWDGGAEDAPWWCDYLEDGRESPAVLTPLGEYWKNYDFSP